MRAALAVVGTFVRLFWARDPQWAHIEFEAAVGRFRIALTRAGWKVLKWRRK